MERELLFDTEPIYKCIQVVGYDKYGLPIDCGEECSPNSQFCHYCKSGVKKATL